MENKQEELVFEQGSKRPEVSQDILSFEQYFTVEEALLGVQKKVQEGYEICTDTIDTYPRHMINMTLVHFRKVKVQEENNSYTRTENEPITQSFEESTKKKTGRPKVEKVEV